MYCKHCGKQISDDSAFCQYCGGKVDAIEQTSKKEILHIQEVVLATKESQPLQVEVSKKAKDYSSTIANEIMGNLKMFGFAVFGWLVFMILFEVFHQKDIRLYPDSDWGESCYDVWNITLDCGSFNYIEILADCKKYRENERKGLDFLGLPRNHKLPKMYDVTDEELEKIAKERAEKNWAEKIKRVNDNRQYSFEEDTKEKAKYSAIILLAFFIIGRYLIKLTKWVGKNKTE